MYIIKSYEKMLLQYMYNEYSLLLFNKLYVFVVLGSERFIWGDFISGRF